MVTVRDATPADAPGLAHLAERTFRNAFGAANSAANMDDHCAENFGPEKQLAEIEDPRWSTLVVDADAALIAYGQLRWPAPPACIEGARPAEIYRLYVDLPWHGQGVAPTLMEALLDRARQGDADAVWLGVWEHNPRAISFYRKAGFREVGAQRFMLGSDPQRDIVMSRMLAV